MNFTLPLLTFIWIATGQPIDQVKHPKPTVNYMHQHMEDHEGIILQWCRSERGVMQVWLASPVD